VRKKITVTDMTWTWTFILITWNSEVFTAVNMKNTVFWYVTSCNLVEASQEPAVSYPGSKTHSTALKIEAVYSSETSVNLTTHHGFTYKQTNSVAWVRKRELYRPNDRRLSAKLVPTLAGRGCRVVSATNPPQSLISVLYNGSANSVEYLLSYPHEAEWTPFQTQFFSENLVTPGIEPGPLDL
jgi:hypothetical protein